MFALVVAIGQKLAGREAKTQQLQLGWTAAPLVLSSHAHIRAPPPATKVGCQADQSCRDQEKGEGHM